MKKTREPNEVRDHILRILAKNKESRVSLHALSQIVNPDGICQNTFTSTYHKIISTEGIEMHERLATLTEEYNPVVGAEVPYLNIEPEGLKIVARIERELEEVPSEALLPLSSKE